MGSEPLAPVIFEAWASAHDEMKKVHNLGWDEKARKHNRIDPPRLEKISQWKHEAQE